HRLGGGHHAPGSGVATLDHGASPLRSSATANPMRASTERRSTRRRTLEGAGTTPMDNVTTTTPATEPGDERIRGGIEVSQPNAWFGSNHAIRDVSVTAEPRAVTAIIGPSGCGKSTFVRCLNRMHEEVHGARVSG